MLPLKFSTVISIYKRRKKEKIKIFEIKEIAPVVKLVDTLDLGSSVKSSSVRVRVSPGAHFLMKKSLMRFELCSVNLQVT